MLRASHFMPRSLLRLRHPHRNRYSLTAPLGAQRNNVDVRNKWPREDLDFTRWLAEHLDVLSGAVGMKLELIQKEKQVGPFYCDILARDVDSDVKVAIENQLESANHSHLGQLLTYAAGLEAQIAVWVAPEILYEHAAALHWLNTWTSAPKF